MVIEVNTTTANPPITYQLNASFNASANVSATGTSSNVFQGATALETAALNLTPGTFQLFNTIGFDDSLLLRSNGVDLQNDLQFAHTLCYDSILKEIHVVWSGHLVDYQHCVYSEATNTWTTRPLPANLASSTSHGYDHNAMDVKGRRFYFRSFLRDSVEIYNLDAQTWSSTSTFSLGGRQDVGGLEWFEAMDRLIYLDGDWGVDGYNTVTNTWTTISGPLPNMGQLHTAAISVPNNDSVILTSGNFGNGEMWGMDSSGTIVQRSNTPGNINVGPGSSSSIGVYDPGSGQFMIFGENAYYEHDYDADSYTVMDGGNAPIFSGIGPGSTPLANAGAVALETYGVIMFVKYQFGTSNIWLYKHPNPTPEQDYFIRSTAPGVVFTENFDTAASVTDKRTGSGQVDVTHSTTNAANGIGSCQMRIPSNTGERSSDWRTNYGDTGSGNAIIFNENSQHYVQFRQKFSADFLNTIFQLTGGSGGWKQAIIGKGDLNGWDYGDFPESGSLSFLELTTNNNGMRLMPQMYHSSFHFAPFWEPFVPDGPKLQNAIDAGIGVTPLSDRFTLWNIEPAPTNVRRPNFPGLYYYPDEWMTFKYEITCGPLGTDTDSITGLTQTGFTNSSLKFWGARDGQPSVLLIDWTGAVFVREDGANPSAEGYGKLWLTPFHTGKDAAQTHPDGFVWYDEVIVSTRDIKDPRTVGDR